MRKKRRKDRRKERKRVDWNKKFQVIVQEQVAKICTWVIIFHIFLLGPAEPGISMIDMSIDKPFHFSSSAHIHLVENLLSGASNYRFSSINAAGVGTGKSMGGE